VICSEQNKGWIGFGRGASTSDTDCTKALSSKVCGWVRAFGVLKYSGVPLRTDLPSTAFDTRVVHMLAYCSV
jgi:hypothetical protein